MATQKVQPAGLTAQDQRHLIYTDDLFNYTRGRFICDEAHEMAQRHVRFNVDELARRAVEAVGAGSCISIKKYPEGLYNKSMLLTMDNGSQVVAKVPNPNAGLPHFTTASEVATMDFVRNVLRIPIPRILAFSSKAHENGVGAEYIIMEKAPGIELEEVWPKMEIQDRLAIVKSLLGFQNAWTSASFNGYGGLYYTDDLDEPVKDEPLYVDANGNEIKNPKFAIGPTTGREWLDNGRATIKMDRGPWYSLEDYHVAIGEREKASVAQLPQLPKSPLSLCGPGTYIPIREKKLRALDCYLKLIKFLLPKDSTISSSHLWHEDLHAGNIFVDPSEPTKIVSIIDWQSTELSPLYFQARQPNIIDYDGPTVYGLERPEFPEDMDRLDADAKRQAETLYLQQSLCILYNTLIHQQNPKLHAALEFQQDPRYMLLLIARNLLIDGEATYMSQVADLETIWVNLPGTKGSPYPFSFSKADKEAIEADVEGAIRGMEAMQSVKETIGDLFPEKGIVRPDQYEEALDAMEQMKEQVIEEFAKSEQDKEEWRRLWPFGT